MPDTFSRDLIDLLPNLRRFALSLSRSGDIADDLVQLTCQKALANRGGFTPGTRMDAWLFRILRNSWIDLVRRRRNEGQSIDIDEAYDVPGQSGAADADTRLLLAQTLEAIHALPDDQRELMLLVCVEELSYRETADVLGIPIGTVMSRLARARKHLGEQLGINRDPLRSDKGKGEK